MTLSPPHRQTSNLGAGISVQLCSAHDVPAGDLVTKARLLTLHYLQLPFPSQSLLLPATMSGGTGQRLMLPSQRAHAWRCPEHTGQQHRVMGGGPESQG